MTSDELATVAQEVSNRNETPARSGVTAVTVVIAAVVGADGQFAISIGTDVADATALRTVLTTILNQL